MSLAIAAEIGEAILAKNVTAAEATLGTLALEGARYGGNAVRKYGNKLRRRIVTPGSREHQLGKRMRQRFAPIKSKRQRKQQNPLQPKKLNFDMEGTTEGREARFGEAPGAGVTKQKGSGYGPGGNLLNFVYETSISYPTKGTDINQRPNDMIFLKGVKYCANFQPLRPGLVETTLCNFAIVSRKENVYSNSDLTNNLFRSREDTRGQSFEDTGEAIDRHCLPINTDKYHVWTHKRFKLRGAGTNLPGSRMLSGYLPVNRQIRFDAANRPNGELLAIWWFGDENTTAATPVTAIVPTGVSPDVIPFNTNIAFTTYWDNPVSVHMLKTAMKSLRRTKYKRRSKSKGPYRGYQ